MTVLLADALYTSDTLHRNYGIVFDKTILEIASNDELRSRYGGACIELGEGSVITPGLINPHVHLEFSANRSQLTYGEFMPWLSSVIAARDELINECDETCTSNAIEMMLSNGITTFGAVSSYGFDLDSCFKAPQKVVFFNELIGSDPMMADALYGNFLERLFASQELKREGFYPSVAIHSPYSVHRILIQKALKLAREKSLRVTAHFMESPSERQWLDTNSGDFQPFFENFLKQHRAANTADEFLELFKEIPTLFTHVIQATSEERARLHQNQHTIIHCPVSNRLLGNGLLDIQQLENENLPWVLGTDGLSSNYALNLFEEMKIALFMHHNHDLLSLAKKLWKSATQDAGKALNLNCGHLEYGYDADLLVTRVNYPLNDQLPLHLLLRPPHIETIYINGTKVKG